MLPGLTLPGAPDSRMALPERQTAIPTKVIDFIDICSYRNDMGHRRPLVTRRYADFGSRAAGSARCPAPLSR